MAARVEETVLVESTVAMMAAPMVEAVVVVYLVVCLVVEESMVAVARSHRAVRVAAVEAEM